MGQNLGFDVNPGGTRLVIGQVVFVFVAWVVCLLRAYVKFFMQRRVLLDDWFMFASLVSRDLNCLLQHTRNRRKTKEYNF